MKNRIRKYLLVFCAAVVLTSSYTPTVYAQKLGNAQSYAKALQTGNEEAAKEAIGSAKKDENGNVIKRDGWDVAGDKVTNIGNAAADAYNNSDGFLKGVWNGAKAAIKTTINETVTTLQGGDVKGIQYEYTNPATGDTETYIRTEWGTNVAEKGNLKGCEPIGIKIIEDRACIFCPLFAVLYDAANEMCQLAFQKLAKPMSNVMLVGFAIFIVIKTLMMVSSLTKQDAPKYLMEFLTQSLKVLISFLLLADASNIYGYFIIPVLSAGLEFGGAMLFTLDTTSSNFGACNASVDLQESGALLPLALYAKLDCFIRSIQAEIAIMQSVGSSLMCVGRHEGAYEIKGIKTGIWDFGMVFNGLIVWIFAVLLSLAFAFYLIDATVTLGLVGALMPFLIACWPFKLTNGYTKKGIETFLNTFFVFVFMGIVVSVNVQLVGTALSGSEATTSQKAATDETSTGQTVQTGGAMKGLIDAINGENMEDLKKLTDIGFGGFLILLCCCIFGFKFTKQATDLADKMAGGGLAIHGIGNRIGGLAASGPANLAKKATQPARQAISSKAADLSNRAGNAIGKRLGIGRHGGKTGDSKQSAPKPSQPQNPNQNLNGGNSGGNSGGGNSGGNSGDGNGGGNSGGGNSGGNSGDGNGGGNSGGN